MILGDVSTVNPDLLKDLAIIGLAVATPLLVWANGRRRKIEPDPLRVEKMDKFVTRDFHNNCHASMEQRVTRAESEIIAIRVTQREMEDRIIKAGEDRATKIHERVDDVLAAVSELKGRVNEAMKKS